MINTTLKNIFICENAIVSFDGKISLINIFSELNTPGLPVINPKFSIVVSISGKVGPHKEIIEIVSLEDNKVIVKTEGTADINGPGGNNFLASFVNVPFATEGRYWIKVTVDGNIMSKQDEHFILVTKKA